MKNQGYFPKGQGFPSSSGFRMLDTQGFFNTHKFGTFSFEMGWLNKSSIKPSQTWIGTSLLRKAFKPCQKQTARATHPQQQQASSIQLKSKQTAVMVKQHQRLQAQELDSPFKRTDRKVPEYPLSKGKRVLVKRYSIAENGQTHKEVH